MSNVPDAQLLSYNDLNFDEPIDEMDNYRIAKYYFLDETNFYIDGVNYTKNRLYHQGVAWLLQISRHHQIRLWISATQDNHVWIAVRQIVNYYVKLEGLKPLMNLAGFAFFTLRVRFYQQSGELVEEFNIAVSNLDFALYDSYWLKDTSYFRPRLVKTENQAVEPENKPKRVMRNWKGQKKYLAREDYEFKETPPAESKAVQEIKHETAIKTSMTKNSTKKRPKT